METRTKTVKQYGRIKHHAPSRPSKWPNRFYPAGEGVPHTALYSSVACCLSCVNTTRTQFLLLVGNCGETAYAQTKFHIILTSSPYLTITFEGMCVMQTHVLEVED